MVSVPSIRPLDLKHLPHVAVHDAKLLNLLFRFLPPTADPERLKEGFEKLCRDELGPFSVKLEKMETAESSAFLPTLPQTGLYMTVGLPPLQEKGTCEVELSFAHRLIDCLLGGEGEVLTSLRPLTEIEEGVFSYLMLKIFALIYDQSGQGGRLHFRLEGFCSSPEELKFLSPGQRLLHLTYQVTWRERSGYFRLLLPGPFVQKALARPLYDSEAKEQGNLKQRTDAWGFVRTDLWLEAGQARLTSAEWQDLKEGDIILVDEAGIGWKQGSLSGTLTLRMGRGEHCGIQGELLSDPSRFRVKVENFFEGVC